MGSTTCFPKVLSEAALSGKRTEVDFAGNNPAIIFDDCDLDACINGSLRSCFTNKGEICTCTRRLYVQRSIYPQFVERFKKAIREKILVGDPRDPAVFYGPYASKSLVERIKSFIKMAREEGADVEFCPNDKQVADSSIRLNEEDGSLDVKGCNGDFLVPTIITK